ncbi:MAG: hypothetical protein ACLQRH_24285 [Acidimicrobiales bacterium]
MTTAATIPPVPPDQLTLLAPSGPGPEVVAAVAAAAQLLWPAPGPPHAPEPVHQAWRFSGRWWARPMPLRRQRPWVRR